MMLSRSRHQIKRSLVGRQHGGLSRGRVLMGTIGSVGIGGGLYLGLSKEDNIRGFRRQAYFWSRLVPIVADYYWHFGSRSPRVLHRNWLNESNDQDESLLLKELHEKHAPEIVDIMIELRGLYVKLGQVLSVTALPIPQIYRKQFELLQSNVDGWESFDTVIQPLLQQEFNVSDLNQIFTSIDTVPCGAASIGQAHKAFLRTDNTEEEEVILKIQYPDASWQVPADIQCIGDFLKFCVLMGLVDENASKLSFQDFSRQFLQELNYTQERHYLETIYKSSLDPQGPYIKHGVIVPKVLPHLCTSRVLCMTYLPGPKLQDEARRNLQWLGIETNNKNVKQFVLENKQQGEEDWNGPNQQQQQQYQDNEKSESTSQSFFLKSAQILTRLVGMDNLLSTLKTIQSFWLWSTGCMVSLIRSVPRDNILPTMWHEWADAHEDAAEAAFRLGLTRDWMTALLDVHGHQIFSLGLFNADPHPGNILVITPSSFENNNNNTSSSFWWWPWKKNDSTSTHSSNNLRKRPQLGLIDFGQCKSLTLKERALIGKFMVAIAKDDDNDEEIANAFRALGIITRNDSTPFLADFARLVFGPLKPHHFDRTWHSKFHKMDHIQYFPKELSMVYRTALLLRGLALSLQVNVSISQYWKTHAIGAIQEYNTAVLLEEKEKEETTTTEESKSGGVVTHHVPHVYTAFPGNNNNKQV